MTRNSAHDDDASTDINVPAMPASRHHHPTCAAPYMKAPTVQRSAIAQYLECRGYQGSNKWDMGVWRWCLGYAMSTVHVYCSTFVNPQV